MAVYSFFKREVANTSPVPACCCLLNINLETNIMIYLNSGHRRPNGSCYPPHHSCPALDVLQWCCLHPGRKFSDPWSHSFGPWEKFLSWQKAAPGPTNSSWEPKSLPSLTGGAHGSRKPDKMEQTLGEQTVPGSVVVVVVLTMAIWSWSFRAYSNS